MKDTIKRIWNDPVWSKVIATVILAVFGALCSLVKAWLDEAVTISEAFKTIFSFKFNVWITGVIFFVVFVAKDLIKQNKEKQKAIPISPFVNGFVKGIYQNQTWKWRWQWSPNDKFYYVDDLNIECPRCHQGVLDLECMDYRCAKCNAYFPFESIKGNSEGVEKQILEDARQKYSNCQELIGRFPD